MEINLLLGSGISIPSNVPGVSELTEKLLTGKWAIQNNRYIEINDDEYRNDPKTISYQKLLQHISDRYSNEEGNLNYEKLFYVIDCLNRYNDHPFEYYIYKSEYNYFKDYFNTNLKPDKWYDFSQIFSGLFKYFQSSISHLLKEYDEIQGLDLLDHIHASSDIDKCNIFTLNHDTLIENYFSTKGYEFNTGFNEEDGDVHLFNYDSLKTNKASFRIIKLHGSVNWFSFAQEFGKYKQSRYGISEKKVTDLKDSKGENYEPLFDYPHFLSGTYNKILDYSNSTFFELRNYFFLKLQELQNTIVSGYGWRDEGINKIIYNWLNKNKENTLHMLYENLTEETGFRDYEFYNTREQIINYGEYLENADWGSIKESLK